VFGRHLLEGSLIVLSGAFAAHAQASFGVPRPRASAPLEAARKVGGDPLCALREATVALAGALRHRFPDWSPEADAMKWRVDRMLAGILDYEQIARRALGSEWGSLSSAQRQQFLRTFSALTNRAFVSALTRPDTHMRFDSETVIGPIASVMVTAWVSQPAARTAQQLEYHLTRKGERWLITDVIVDRVSLVDSYRDRFARLMRKGGFGELMSRMEHRLEIEGARP
jgi:ABC-type transporter MlaC component